MNPDLAFDLAFDHTDRTDCLIYADQLEDDGLTGAAANWRGYANVLRTPTRPVILCLTSTRNMLASPSRSGAWRLWQGWVVVSYPLMPLCPHLSLAFRGREREHCDKPPRVRQDYANRWAGMLARYRERARDATVALSGEPGPTQYLVGLAGTPASTVVDTAFAGFLLRRYPRATWYATRTYEVRPFAVVVVVVEDGQDVAYLPAVPRP
jgi:hypothetical protein